MLTAQFSLNGLGVAFLGFRSPSMCLILSDVSSIQLHGCVGMVLGFGLDFDDLAVLLYAGRDGRDVRRLNSRSVEFAGQVGQGCVSSYDGRHSAFEPVV